MNNLKLRSKGYAKGLPRVFFTCHPDDFERSFDWVCGALDEAVKCAVYYPEDMALPLTEEQQETDLTQMNLFIVPVSIKTLTEPCRTMDSDVPFAFAHNIAVLPIMMESGLDEIYSRPDRFGTRQYLDPFAKDDTAILFKDKLYKHLSELLIDDETAKRVRAAFDAYIFLSYRKKDRRLANELMKRIHSDPRCRDVAIWYDEFLIPGESFSEGIADALDKSSLFTLMITPSLLEDGNYVLTHEYPMAVGSGKTILPAEVSPTDRGRLADCYKDLPEVIDGNDGDAVCGIIDKNVDPAVKTDPDDPEKLYLMGLAYQEGIDVEIDRKRGTDLIEKAAQALYPQAVRRLRNMYFKAVDVRFDYEKAAFWAGKLVDILTEEKGEKDPQTLKELNLYGRMLKKAGRIKEAKDVYQKTSELMTEVYGGDHSETLSALNNLALAFSESGEYGPALETAKRVYGIRLNDLGEDDPDTLQALGNLAGICKEAGDLKTALSMQEKAFEGAKKVLGADDENTLNTQVNLGITYKECGSYDKALSLIKNAWEQLKKLRGANHPDTLRAESEIGEILSEKGEYRQAAKVLVGVAEKQCTILGKFHPKTVATVSRYASALRDAGDPASAAKLQEYLYKNECEIYGSDSRKALSTLNNLALSLCDLGRTDEAIEKQTVVVETNKRRFGPEHPDTLSSMGLLGSIYSQAKNYEKSSEIKKEVLEKETAVLGAKHPKTLVTMGNLASDLEKLGKTAEAVALKEKVLEYRAEVLGETHPNTITAMANLGSSYLDLKQRSKAASVFERAYRAGCVRYGEEHSTTLLYLSLISRAYFGMGDYSKSLDGYQKVYDIQNRKLGSDHRDTLSTAVNIAVILDRQGQSRSAYKLIRHIYERCLECFGASDPDTLRAKKQAERIKGNIKGFGLFGKK